MSADANINLCTAVLPKFSFQDVIDIAASSGYQGVELRVSGDYHKSLNDLDMESHFLKRGIEKAGLKVPVLTSYIPVDDEESVDRLLRNAEKMDVPKARLVLPRS